VTKQSSDSIEQFESAFGDSADVGTSTLKDLAKSFDSVDELLEVEKESSLSVCERLNYVVGPGWDHNGPSKRCVAALEAIDNYRNRTDQPNTEHKER